MNWKNFGALSLLLLFCGSVSVFMIEAWNYITYDREKPKNLKRQLILLSHTQIRKTTRTAVAYANC
jgi:hypothetical protein